MDRLPSVIGEAPSELSFVAFMAKLTQERERVRLSIAAFREGKKLSTTPRGRKAKVGKTDLLAEYSMAELLKGLELIKKGALNGNKN